MLIALASTICSPLTPDSLTRSEPASRTLLGVSSGGPSRRRRLDALRAGEVNQVELRLSALAALACGQTCPPWEETRLNSATRAATAALALAAADAHPEDIVRARRAVVHLCARRRAHALRSGEQRRHLLRRRDARRLEAYKSRTISGHLGVIFRGWHASTGGLVRRTPPPVGRCRRVPHSGREVGPRVHLLSGLRPQCCQQVRKSSKGGARRSRLARTRRRRGPAA